MKPRCGARVDEIQPAIIDILEEAGVKVEVLDVSRAGVPDVLCGFLGRLTLLELKSPGGRLSEAQLRAHEAWAAVGVKVVTVRTARDALDAVGITGELAEENLRAWRLLVSERRRVAQVRGRLQPAVRRP